MTNSVSFIVQVDNESDSDRCRYALVSLDERRLRERLRTVESQASVDLGFTGIVFSDGIVAVHFLDASFPVDHRTSELPEGQEPFLTDDEADAVEAEGWASVPFSLVSGATSTMSGFVEEVDDVRLLVTPAGLQVCASWELDDRSAFLRSWTVPWDVLPAEAG